MGATWVLLAPDGPHVGPMNLAIWDGYPCKNLFPETTWLIFKRIYHKKILQWQWNPYPINVQINDWIRHAINKLDADLSKSRGRRLSVLIIVNTWSAVASATRINFNPSMDTIYIHYKVWNEITYPFSNFNGVTVEVCKWISNFIAHFTKHVITYPCWN